MFFHWSLVEVGGCFWEQMKKPVYEETHQLESESSDKLSDVSVVSPAAAVEQIIISDDEEATVRSLQMEEDEALARSLQVEADPDKNASPEAERTGVHVSVCSSRLGWTEWSTTDTVTTSIITTSTSVFFIASTG